MEKAQLQKQLEQAQAERDLCEQLRQGAEKNGNDARALEHEANRDAHSRQCAALRAQLNPAGPAARGRKNRWDGLGNKKA